MNEEMKRFMLAILAITAIAFTGCSKDDEKNDLNGTTWKHNETIYPTVCIYTIKFTSDTECIYIWSEKNTIDDTEISGSEKGTYTYDAPNVYFYSLDGELTITGTIKENVLKLGDLEYIKQ